MTVARSRSLLYSLARFLGDGVSSHCLVKYFTCTVGTVFIPPIRVL